MVELVITHYGDDYASVELRMDVKPGKSLIFYEEVPLEVARVLSEVDSIAVRSEV